jgi:alkylated DNA nucleotide flippase Atl1
MPRDRDAVGAGPTSFQQAVHDVLVDLRPGQVVSYSWVAHAAGAPNADRAVGTHLKSQSDPPNWWCVVAADGRLVAPSADEQARRLRAEGQTVVDGRVHPGPEHPR